MSVESFVYFFSQNCLTLWIGIRANPSDGTPGFKGGINSAILRYDGAPIAEPTSVQTPGLMLNEWELSPYDLNQPVSLISTIRTKHWFTIALCSPRPTS